MKLRLSHDVEWVEGFFGSVVQYAWCLEKIKGRWYHAVIPATGVWFSVKEIL